MANLPSDKLPDEFELVVHGTGLTESILAAAASRVSKSVLHIDRNSFYGELWGTLLHRDVEEWLIPPDKPEQYEETIETPPLSSGEEAMDLHSPHGVKQVFNVEDIIIQDNEPSPQSLEEAPTSTATTSTEKQDKNDDNDKAIHEETTIDSDPSPQSLEDVPTSTADKATHGETTAATLSVTWTSLGKSIKRFNYDVLPKLLYCRGKLVDVITASGVSRYMEFKAVDKFFLFGKDSTLLQVPSSRSDVFSNKTVSMLDKRRLMKFLSFCVEYDQHSADYEAYQDKPYREFLTSQGLSDMLSDFIIYSLAFSDDTMTTNKGLELTQLFLKSLGRFGNAPFLYPIFGVGEIPQAFCRLSAVYGGVYCLKRSLKSVVTENGVVKGVICTSGQRIKCSKIICNVSMFKGHIDSSVYSESVISRAVYISDRPLTEDSQEKVIVITVPPGCLGPEQSNKIQLIQLDSTTLNTVQGTYMVHAVYNGQDVSLLKLLADKLYNGDDKPRLLRALYYNVKLFSVVDKDGIKLPENVTVTTDPDSSLSYESCIEQAKEIFSKIYPDEEFLPKIPEPEEIIYEDYDEEETPATMDAGKGTNEEETSSPLDEGIPLSNAQTVEGDTPPSAATTGQTPDESEETPVTVSSNDLPDEEDKSPPNEVHNTTEGLTDVEISK